ncbi:DeoR/GlpR family DNA-binding transcription regulator [Vagococcus silagei]|uniref:Lactose phosphotransferase system repressor n=1 Tax=Vagococcus silagei TaxID=2508885 RepID=A0A4S3B2U1_9ENTE|nr:DeoR/GlpR family DNA-binding transcription regulator [Vagococcus silagei]THB60728.1 DeoR/GlpR transcriptional regulator [Vagococcus silagei]
MIQEERMTDILNILKKRKKISNDELASILYCSPSTLRRDLIKLENQKLIRRVVGGSVLNIASTNEPSFYYRETNQIPEKKMICELAKDFIGDGMCIFVDSSSTVQQLIPLLETVSNLVILTNGLRVALSISDMNDESIKAFLIGGEIKRNSSSVVGTDFSKSFTEQFNIDLAIFSCRGIDQKGVYEASLSQAQIKQNFLKTAQKSILLVDDTKFDSTHFFKVADLDKFSNVITNKKPDDSYLETFEEKGIECFYEDK